MFTDISLNFLGDIMQRKLAFTMIFSILLIGIIMISSLFTFVGTSVTNNVESIDSTQTTSLSQVTIYLSLKGETQGDIKGSVTAAGHEDQIQVLAVTHSVVSPRDAASGLPTGKRQHHPLVITKEIDKSSTFFEYGLSTNEKFPDFKLEFYRLSRKVGTLEHFYTIELDNANIASIVTQISEYGAVELISFTYQKIYWTWEDGGYTAEDDWESPIV